MLRSVQGCRRAKNKTCSPFDDHWVIRSTLKGLPTFEVYEAEFAAP